MVLLKVTVIFYCVYLHVTYEEVCSQLINSSYSTCHLSGLQQHVQPKHPPIYVYVISYLYLLTLPVAKLYSCEANSTVVVVTVLTTNCLWHAHVMKPSVCTPVLLLDLYPAC